MIQWTISFPHATIPAHSTANIPSIEKTFQVGSWKWDQVYASATVRLSPSWKGYWLCCQSLNTLNSYTTLMLSVKFKANRGEVSLDLHWWWLFELQVLFDFWGISSQETPNCTTWILDFKFQSENAPWKWPRHLVLHISDRSTLELYYFPLVLLQTTLSWLLIYIWVHTL